MEPNQLPVSASLGAMGSLAAKLDALQDADLKVKIWKLTNWLLLLSKERDPSVAARIWMKDVLELSYDMENCVDVSEPDWIGSMPGFKARVEVAIERYHRYKLGSTHNFTNTATNFKIRVVDGQRRPDLAVVGLHDEGGAVDRLIQLLTDDGKTEPKVVSIVGVGGIGKTTLAKELWREKKLGRFHCRAFVRTAKKADMGRILRSILAQVRPHQPPDTDEVHELIHDVRTHLQGKRYFIIIDDLWATSVWDVARRAFPESNGSKIITTTEIKDVSLACCSYQSENIFKMKPLSVSQSQELFISGVFGSGEEKSRQLDGVSGEIITEEKSLQLGEGPEEIVIEEKSHKLDEVSEDIITEVKSHELDEASEEMIIEEKSRKFVKMSDEIITRCAGLPLAIISISSVLASQREANTIHNWVEVQNNSPINTTPVEVLKQVLNFCYNCLPSYLQTCLLYLSVYPENYMILKEDIMKQWVAEGFIVAPTENDKMKVAGNYFDKLVSMGLIQHIDVGYCNEVHYYAVHHMVHDLITSKSKEENFTTVIDYSERKVGFSNKVSRLSLQFGSATYATIPESIGLSQVRSLAFIGLKSCYSSILEFKVLRFLILHMWADQPRTGLDLKPTSELVVLKSLQVTCNDTVHLPDLMQGPKQLVTLEINARVAAIPTKIVHLRSWLHLRLGVGTELTDLTGILKNDTLKPSIALYGSSSPPNSVTTLELLSPICGVPKWIGHLTNLCILKFVLGELQSDDIHNLQGLPLLTVLSLDVQRPTTGPIGFAPGLFDALEYFEFRCGVLRLAFEKGAMRNLQRLRLCFNAHRGEHYDDWLHGIEHLSNVKEISGIIGVGTGADQRDLDNAQSAFVKAIGKHGRRIVRLKRADMVEELYFPAEKQHEIQGEQPSTSSSQRVGSPKLESQDVHGPLETQHEIPEKKPTTSNGQLGSPTQESPDVCGPPEKQHEISEEQPSTSSEQPASTNQDYQKEIKQDSGSNYQFINRMPSPGAPSKNMYSKHQQPAATPQKNEFTSKKERSITDLVVGMAKAVVDGALTKAQEAIAEEAKLRQRAQRNLMFITDEFQMMQSCLKNIAGSERLENPVVRTWVWQIRELAYNVEDCIEFVGHLDKKNRWWLRLLKPMNLLTPCIHVALPLDVAVDELDQLKARVEEVSSRNARYSLISSQSGFKPVAAEAQPASHDTVGMTALNRLIEAANTNKEEIIHLLPKKDQDLGVISIWGTGGGDVGMPSIAWNAFTDDETCQNFVCRAWVKLMHPFDPREFVQSLTAQFYANSYYKEGRMMSVDGVHALMKMEEATRGGDPLKDFERLVMENRYLVVLEDLSTVAEWAAIRRFFPNMKNGSCVILSTQQFEVASLSVGRPFNVLHLNELQAEHSVYVFFTEGSWYDGDKGMERNSGVSSGNCKKEAAKRWIDQHPLIGRELEMKDLGLKVIVARAKGYQVMSVWGFAGVGKSALVKNMFCEKILKGKLFQKYGWVDVPHPFNLRDFSQTLLWNFGSEYLQDSERAASLCSMGSRNPIAECREILKQHRCLVVIDALQSKEDWDLIKDDLVSGSHRQNVIIVVTTEQEIATHCRGDKGELVFNVKGLEANTAVELFEKVSNKGEVAEIRELTSICGGLPKVIVEIAGTFAKNTDRWKDAPSTNNNFMLELENNGEFVGLRGLFDWMNSSFRNCPDSLKACILYLPVFPRNYLIRRRRLIRRWIAEGYSRDHHQESAEMTGEKQFQDLLDLRIIQQPSMLGLGDTRCQVNGFFREYIVSHQTEETLVFELTGSCVLTTQRTGRHLVISESWDRNNSVFESIDFSRLRSLTVFGKWESFFISESMKLLRVLDLEDASEVVYSDLKKMVKLLCRLKFLSLRGCHDIHHLPSSIDNLRQLQSLDVRHTSIVTLPRNITKLQKLQYIRAGTTAPANSSLRRHHLLSRLSSRHLVGIVVPPGIGKLTALQRLSVVNVNASGTKAVLEELKKLIHLHKLGVSGINKNNSNKFFLALSDTVHLESLSVRLEVNNQACLDDIPLPLPIKSLQSLKLYGLGDRLPNWKAQLTMLTKMDLEIAKLTEDHVSGQSEGVTPQGMRKPTIGVIKFLSELPGLCILRLHVHHLQDNQLDVSIITNDLEEDSFEKMKIFEIACSSSSKITFGEKTMKKLEQLKVDCCRGSSLLGLKHLPELKEVLLKGSSDEALKADLIKELENHPKQKRPVVKLEELPSSS